LIALFYYAFEVQLLFSLALHLNLTNLLPFLRFYLLINQQNKNPHVKSLPGSFSQSSEQRLPTDHRQLIHGKSGSAILVQQLRYSTDEEDSSITSGSGRLQMTAGRSSGLANRNQLLVPNGAAHYSRSSGGAGTGTHRQRIMPSAPSRNASAISGFLESSPLIASHNFVTEDELQVCFQENLRLKQEQLQLQEQLEQIRTQCQADILLMHQSLQDERERCEVTNMNFFKLNHSELFNLTHEINLFHAAARRTN
jgi:hypothetical protein